jgi:hypothetical protein
MSFFFGTILEKQVLLASDRMYYYGDEVIIGHSKIHKINKFTFLTFGGDIFVGNEIFKIIRDLCPGPISPFQLEGSLGRCISKQALSFWTERVLGNSEIVTFHKERDLPLVSNILFGGLDLGDHPFLVSLFDGGNFKIQVYTRPAVSFISANSPDVRPNGPEVTEEVRKKIREFLKVAMGKSEKEQQELGKEMLPGVLEYVSQHDKFVSSAGDLIFIHGGGSELFTFGVGRWRGVMERISLYLQSISERLEERKRLDWEKWQRRKKELTEQRKKPQERWQAGIDRLFNRFFRV